MYLYSGERKLNSDKIEQCWCEIRIGCESILVGCIYRAPKIDLGNIRLTAEIFREAKRLVESKRYSSLLVAGDFNLPKINWSEGFGSSCKEGWKM